MPLETHDTPTINTLRVPKTWGELAEMHASITNHFGDARIAALSDPQRSSEASELDSHIAQESWKRKPEENPEDALPQNVRKMAEQYLIVLGVGKATTSESVVTRVSKATEWLRSAISSFHF